MTTIPFIQYLSLKDNYCLGYFGDDVEMLNMLVKAKELIENELRGVTVYIACKDLYKDYISDTVIPESRMTYYKGKMAYFCILEKKDDIKSLLRISKITIPDNF